MILLQQDFLFMAIIKVDAKKYKVWIFVLILWPLWADTPFIYPSAVFVPFQTVLVLSLLATERARDSRKANFEIIIIFLLDNTVLLQEIQRQFLFLVEWLTRVVFYKT